MSIQHKPFVSKTLEYERDRKIISVALNKKEQAWLEEIKEDLNIGDNSKALKMAAFIGRNVVQATFSRPILRYLFKKDRQKLEDFKNF